MKISNDKNGNYLKLEIQLPDGSAIIRWGLDDYTYEKIKAIVSKNYFDSLAVDYHYEMLPYVIIEKSKNEQKFIGIVRCIQGTRAKRIEFQCTEKFAGNIEWFKRDVLKIKDIRYLFWEDNS